MKELRSGIILAIILFILSILISGCAIGIKPRSYDVPPENQYYSESTTYDSYYSSPRAGASYYYDSNYDPWTMGTYYQNYSGPPQTYGTPGGSSSYIDSKRSDSSGSAAASQAQAPGSRDTSSKTDRTSIRNRSNIAPGSSDSAMDSQKVRRERQNPQPDDTIEHRRLKSRITSPQKDSSETQDEDEQNK